MGEDKLVLLLGIWQINMILLKMIASLLTSCYRRQIIWAPLSANPSVGTALLHCSFALFIFTALLTATVTRHHKILTLLIWQIHSTPVQAHMNTVYWGCCEEINVWFSVSEACWPPLRFLCYWLSKSCSHTCKHTDTHPAANSENSLAQQYKLTIG